MKKSLNTTVLLALVLVGLVAWYTLYEKRYKGKQTEKEENAKKLVTLTSDAISEVTIVRMKNPPAEGAPVENPEYETIQLVKTGTDWEVTLPVKDQADAATVTSTLNVLTSSKEERIVDENPKDLAGYGLDKPVAKITLKQDSKTEELLIGGNTPVGFSSYAKLADKPQVYKVSRSVRTQFEKEPGQYRNKALVPYKRDEVDEIELQVGKDNIVLTKGEKDAWTLARENLPADSNEVSKTLNGLVDLKAQGILSDSPSNLSEYGLTQPLVKATLRRAKDKKKFQVIIGKGTNKNKDKYYARKEDRLTVYEIVKTSVDPLERPAGIYRDMKLANFNRFNAQEIKFEKGEASFDLQKNELAWNFPADKAIQLDPGQVDAFLTKLQDSRLVRYTNQKTHPSLKEPKLVLRVIEKKDNQNVETVLLTFGTPANKEVLVKKKDLDQLVAIKEEDFLKLNAPKTAFIKEEKKAEETKDPAKKSE